MVQTTADIDRIVREVLAELGLLAQTGATRACDCASAADATAPSDPDPVEPPSPPPRPAGDVVVADRVVTLAGIGERLASARRLVVQPRAVVTPAVRDELRRRNVTLVVEKNTATATTAGGKVALTALGSRIDPKPLADELTRQDMAVDVQRFDCLIRATDDMAKRLMNAGTTGVLLSNYGAVAICLANRHQGVRAILASDESRTAADAVSVGANVLVLEPRRTVPETMRQIVTAFCQQRPGECPEALRDRLG
jgi:ribose 5-phosphate isomerase RpiB